MFSFWHENFPIMAMVFEALHLTWKYTHFPNPCLLTFNMTFNNFTIDVRMLTWNVTSNTFMVDVCMSTFNATSNAFTINAHLLAYDATSNAFMIDVCLPTSFQHSMSKTFDIPSNTRPLSNFQLLLALTKKPDLLVFTKIKPPTSLDTSKTCFIATIMAFLHSQNYLSH